ncbi:uncharacterized protein B0I36DRAFT_377831 [Microdochium trichocladiopsis]|uniref:Glycosyltransferase family 25 protein n=1 Tax=Microdochium trichocladiopsis TaxID=1682393 RepID=A0A9P8XW37_9PEZI|nr:uncharacterized protein B0I36DRAFT_377831 [Microdochium trichocladiopsis]KAH7016205.1 hypothetical protein B0I36DRAFT_377831 [Microdochium trichocladiopsis]
MQKHQIASPLVIADSSLRPASRFSTPQPSRSSNARQWSARSMCAAANATLGFENLLVLSNRPSWRTRGVQAAANLTGLEFTIPPQPPNSKATVEAFMSISPEGEKSRPALGSATAWLAHIDLLKHILSSDLETAFIVEDDVDWDVRIKNQLRLVSDNVRAFRRRKINLTDEVVVQDNDAESDPNDNTPYGTDWDVLWLGHCGSLGHDDDKHRRPLPYEDESRVPGDKFTGWSRDYFLEETPEGHRVVQESRMTICTFGYAVSRQGVLNVLAQVMKGGYEAFDVALHAHCSEGRLKCVTVSPAVFHHYEPSAAHGYVSPVKEGDGKGKAKSENEFEGFMGTTANIVDSARCHALWGKSCLP